MLSRRIIDLSGNSQRRQITHPNNTDTGDAPLSGPVELCEYEQKRIAEMNRRRAGLVSNVRFQSDRTLPGISATPESLEEFHTNKLSNHKGGFDPCTITNNRDQRSKNTSTK